MLLPEQVVPFLQHADPIVRDHAHRYFRGSVDFGPLTAETYWAIIDRLGKTDAALGFAADLKRVPQTDESLHRLTRALATPQSGNFAHHYQHAAYDMQLDVLARNRAELLACPQLVPHVRQHLELRLRLLDESPESAWDRLMQHGRELAGANAFTFNPSLGQALVEAAGRGGASVCEKAMVMLNDESAAEDWREIFAVRVLGEGRYEPAIDPLVEKFAFDTDIVREDVNTALALIGTPRVIDRIVAFYPGKPWHVRLYAHGSLVRLKRPESEAGLLKLLGMEIALEKDGAGAEDSLLDSILIDLGELCSLSALEESRRFIAESPNDPEADELCQDIVATAIMNGVTLPEETDYRKRIQRMLGRIAAGSAAAEAMLGGVRENWMKTGISFPPAEENRDEDHWHSRQSAMSVSDYQRPDRIEPIRNTAPKIGRNDPCPCGSGKKYKKCCAK